jgi:hypothetical protein
MMIVTLLKSMLSISGLEDLSSELMTHYTTLLPEKIGSGYCFPSFLFLSKYWQDTSGLYAVSGMHFLFVQLTLVHFISASFICKCIVSDE